MILRNSDYVALVKRMKENNSKVIVYGAGMVGQIIVPYLVREYNLYNLIDCFIDMDKRKNGQKVVIDNYSYEIRTPDYLESSKENLILLITNSRFIPVVRFLDSIGALNDAEGYIIPMMQIHAIDNEEPIHIERINEIEIIPRKIHYCWFGGKEIPEFLQNCINSWKELCPDYEIIEWNESNYDVNKHKFTKEAFEQKKYGFVTDVARLDILYENGGIYLDTDVTLIKNLDDCLYQQGFVGVEKWGNVNTGGGCGFMKQHPMLKQMLDHRVHFSFVMEDESLNMDTNGIYETNIFLAKGFKPNNSMQIIGGVTVYPPYINHPYDYMSGEMHIKDSTVSIHHFNGGWMKEDDLLNRKKTQDEYKNIVERIDRTEQEIDG
ncbi:MAG TPA: hypothetical protein DHW61_00440 [Lachnoclostridium phytofermentans]|uniref:Glycosyl transferase n=1 Tax=Lachnoclostridium phytofermentans TaxID=66219 RepID=A0A3D2X155_9FIRM|nr:glycosyltransferase [Lachnoclostridium sp.]HCL00889.1 hypothetical protein [Lachnoclostridium phytofermentans]